MPNIDDKLTAILEAKYGEAVRGSIHDAIEEINEVVENWESGLMDTTLTSTTLPAQAKVVGDVATNLKNSISVLNNGENTLPMDGHSIIQGSYGGHGEVIANSGRIRVDGFVDVYKGQKLIFKSGTNTTQMMVGYFTTAEHFVRDGSWVSDGGVVNIDSDGKLCVIFRKNSSNPSITPSEYDATTTLISPIDMKIEGLSKLTNLVGEDPLVKYPVYIEPGESVTFSTKDGTALSENARLYFLDENGGYITYSTLFGAERTLTLTGQTTARYLVVDRQVSQPIMIVYGTTSSAYSAYIKTGFEEAVRDEWLTNLLGSELYKYYEPYLFVESYPYLSLPASNTQLLQKLGATMALNGAHNIKIGGTFSYDRLPSGVSFAGFRLYELDGNGSTVKRDDFNSVPREIKLNASTVSISLYIYVTYDISSDTTIGFDNNLWLIVGDSEIDDIQSNSNSLENRITAVENTISSEYFQHQVVESFSSLTLSHSNTQYIKDLTSRLPVPGGSKIAINGTFSYENLPAGNVSFAGLRVYEIDAGGTTLVRNNVGSLPTVLDLNTNTTTVVVSLYVTYDNLSSDAYINSDVNIIISKSVELNDWNEIPDYCASMMVSKCAEIRDNMAEIGRNGESIIFITDTHIPSNAMNSPALIKYLMDNCNLDFVVFGGDCLNRDTAKATVYKRFTDFLGKFKERGITVHSVVGNHEFNNPGSSTDPAYVAVQLSDAEVYPFLVKPEEGKATIDGDSLAYYFDNPTQKDRYIFVPCGYNSGISSDVTDFVINEAIGTTPSGYNVIVFAHRAVMGLPSDPNHGIASPFRPIANALDALIGTDKTPVCVIAGHSHIDDSVITSGGIPIILTTTDAYSLEEGDIDRTKDTATEQAFDVIQINKSTRTIKCVRIGGGSNRTFAYPS